jgi:hypothetical protein
MNLDWILNPLTAYVLIALALVACIICYVSITSEVQRLRRASASTQAALKQKVEQMESAVSTIGRQRHEPAVIEVAARSSAAIRPSLNLTRRTQALRMRRRGESIESIAAALSTPRNEIELLVKVYEMLEYRRQLKAPAEPAV